MWSLFEVDSLGKVRFLQQIPVYVLCQDCNVNIFFMVLATVRIFRNIFWRVQIKFCTQNKCLDLLKNFSAVFLCHYNFFKQKSNVVYIVFDDCYHSCMHKVFVLIVINNVLAALKKFDAIHTFLFCFIFEPSDQKLRGRDKFNN